MKKAVVFYLWGKRNAGDMAICLGTVSILQELGYKVTFVSRFAKGQEDYQESKEYIQYYHNNVEVKPGLFSFDRENSKEQKLISYMNGIIKLISPNDKQLKKIISDADVIFLNGGNQLRGNSFTDYARLAALFYPFKLASKLNKPTICLPQSTAESSKFGLSMLKNRLGSFNQVFIRESSSFTLLNEKIKGVPFIKSTDACFFIKDVQKASDKFKRKYSSIMKTNNKCIAIVLRSTTIGDLGDFKDNKKQLFADSIRNFVKEFKDDYKLYFVVQTKKDKEYTQFVMNHVDVNAVMIEEYDPYVIREFYRNMHFVVAMRLHASILSLTAGTPVLGYFDKEWGLKNPGIMNDVGMPWTANGNELVQKGREIELRREEYVEKIKSFIDVEKRKISKAFIEN
ncbi:polysaccharide pyruvyl transferase family protein [Alteribacter populi]|uniref:polysaccharide pyruvyl transferase family protein n=1 Tax=Alteribacter populi TaxID=2011011 RepID=UPI000BBA9817|nr:polysaccharide pyruvyl transferase family protein [Alteribacter populi]